MTVLSLCVLLLTSDVVQLHWIVQHFMMKPTIWKYCCFLTPIQKLAPLSVPVVCVTGLFKLCPVFPHDNDSFNMLLSPSAVANHSEEGLEIINPKYDYVPPELVDLYITNIGGHQPSYINRLVAEHYHTQDEMGNEYM